MRLLLFASLVVPSLAFSAELTRGPVLALPGPTEMTVVFLTDVQASGEVRFGERGQPLLQRVVELTPGTQHTLHLTGLSPSTSYDYEVLVDGVVLAGGDTFRFKTSPQPGTPTPFRLFAWGDSGLGTVEQLKVANRLARNADEATMSLMLGDIVYYSGEPELYDARFFGPYAELTRRMVVWPTIGNHDVGLDPMGGPYLDAFTLPTNNPAQTELYYSFDYGDAHFVCLDTHVNPYTSTSPQVVWAAADLAVSTARWKFAFFHVPPYSGGTHPDNALLKSDVVPMLEAAGVDLVFAGHSHAYERTFLLGGNAIVQGDASEYARSGNSTGTLYVVSGTSGQTGALSNPNHPLMAFQAGNVLGVSVVDLVGNDLRGYFLLEDGSAIDLFHLRKGNDAEPPRIVTVRDVSATELEVVFDEPLFAGAGPGGAERLGAWDVRPRLPVLAARLLEDQRTVRLTTPLHRAGAWDVWAVGIGDRSGRGNLSSTHATLVTRRSAVLTTGQGAAYFDGTVPAQWRDVGFDAAGWSAGDLPIGYGVATLNTTVPATTTLYVRVPFALPAPRELLGALTLELDYDDGFVASINGVEVRRQNVGAGQSASTLASASREEGLRQRYALGPPASALLREGSNVLAVEVHNSSPASSDLYLSVRLEAVVESPDAGPMDAGMEDVDAGESDAGLAPDAGSTPPGDGDAGSDGGNDAGPSEPPLPHDAGLTPDGGTSRVGGGGCTCSAVAPEWVVLLGLLFARRRR